MIGRKSSRLKNIKKPLKLKGFDDFEVSLGDVMRGERATRGKSLMDVQHDLRIKAAYIAGVEDCDPSVFDTPGFIAGYVRSYAKYLGMDPDAAFEMFCKESGFESIHGMSERALPTRLCREDRLAASITRRPAGAIASTTPFLPPKESFFNRVDVRAFASSMVLMLLLGGLGYGAYSVVQKIQRVQMVPVEQAPLVASDLDPLRPRETDSVEASLRNAQSDDIYSRIYQPQALDVPVVVPRDGPIANIDPAQRGAFAAQEPPMVTSFVDESIEDILAGLVSPAPEPEPKAALQVVESFPAPVQLVSSQGVWLRVKDAEGLIIFERIMDARTPYEVPLDDPPAVIERAGNASALFFLVNGALYGPAGASGRVAKNIELSAENLTQTYEIFTPQDQSPLYSFLLELETDRVKP